MVTIRNTQFMVILRNSIYIRDFDARDCCRRGKDKEVTSIVLKLIVFR